MLDLAPRFFQATGQEAVLLYKEEIEVLLRTPGYPGFSLLDLHDYPGQGTALIGPLDPFWDSKGFVTPEAHRRYCGPTVPLLRMKKRTFTVDETLTAAVEDGRTSARRTSAGAGRSGRIKDREGRVVASGALPAVDLAHRQTIAAGADQAPRWPRPPRRAKLTVSVALAETPFTNDWDIWVYPRERGRPICAKHPPGRSGKWGLSPLAEVAGGREQALGRGNEVGPGRRQARAVLASVTSPQSLPGSFLPVFWSPIWFPTQRPNTMGILCDPKHPALARFPTEFYSNWQWYELLNHSQSVILDETPADFRPIVMVIDNFARNHKLGVIWRPGPGKGRLLVCGIDLPGLAGKQPAARQLCQSLCDYAGSAAFQPAHEIPAETLEKLFPRRSAH